MLVKELIEQLSALDENLEVRVLDVLHHPMANYVMSHRAEAVVNNSKYACIVAHGAGLFPISRDVIPEPIEPEPDFE